MGPGARTTPMAWRRSARGVTEAQGSQYENVGTRLAVHRVAELARLLGRSPLEPPVVYAGPRRRPQARPRLPPLRWAVPRRRAPEPARLAPLRLESGGRRWARRGGGGRRWARRGSG